MVEKKPKRAVILVLSDSMLKARYGVSVQELVNERGKTVLVNAVGGCDCGGSNDSTYLEFVRIHEDEQ